MSPEEREALIAQGWTPPVTVDPDVELAKQYTHELFSKLHIYDRPTGALIDRAFEYILGAIREGRALERAEAKAYYAALQPKEGEG